MGCQASSGNVKEANLNTRAGDVSCMCWDDIKNKPRLEYPMASSKNAFTEVKWSVLIVHLHEATNLPQSDWFSATDAFMKCTLLADEGSTWKGKESAGIEDINRCAFRVKENSNSPKWDAKQTICFDADVPRKDLRLHCELFDKDILPFASDSLGKVVLPIPDSDTPDWMSFRKSLAKGGEVRISLKTVQSPFYDVPSMDFLQRDGWKEEIIIASKEKASLLYNVKAGNSKMIFLVPGRDDTFMHFHMVKPFQDRGFDIFCFDYHGIGRSKRFGVGKEADLYSSHADDHNEYWEEFDIALKFIEKKGNSYKVAMYHAHSTGGPIFLNYCLERKDNFGMTHLILNSPFIGSVVEAADERLAAFVTEDFAKKRKMTPGKTPVPGNAAKEGTVPPWFFKLWAQYRHHPNLRPICLQNAVTMGFFSAVQKTQAKIEEAGVVTTCPTLLLCSKNDDILDQKDMFQAADKISPNIMKIVFDYHCHDVYLAYEAELTEQAINILMSWVDEKVSQ